jgi:starch synthase (maltosyl-transferring)
MAAPLPRLEMTPATGERVLRFVGDRIQFRLRPAGGEAPPDGWQAFLRTTLGRGAALRSEIIRSRGGERPLTGASWRDVPMRRDGAGWTLELTLTEVGYFKSKAYALNERGWQAWPDGSDVGVTVHPDSYRTGNTIYCAFTRLFGETKSALSAAEDKLEAPLKPFDKRGYTIIPPSGKLRDLAGELPHIIDTLGCRIVHLLPVNPTPTTYARFGRHGSPYAGLDLTAIDPALVEFDRRTTAVDQFRELAHAAHAKGARLFLDLVINHTGWSSTLHEDHPEWFLRSPDGSFQSPGAWGVTWEDLVELDEEPRELWDVIAGAFLTWCRRGVDGFRCDAGYKVGMPVWQYIIARVRAEFPDTLFLLEGLGGGWQDTENLLTEGGMQWAYSELFQEMAGFQVAGYLDHALKQSRRVGVLVHYSETHDNERLAKKGRAWSLLRNRLCALTSVGGGFGFTCGVEWLATEKIKVHGCAGLNWHSTDNLLPELAQLNGLISQHPCFHDDAKLTRLSPTDSPVLALQRISADGRRVALVLANTEVEKANALKIEGLLENWRGLGLVPPDSKPQWSDLLAQPAPGIRRTPDGALEFTLAGGACHCLAPFGTAPETAEDGDRYRRERAQAAFAVRALSQVCEPEEIGPCDWRALAQRIERDPREFLGSLAFLDRAQARVDLLAALDRAREPRRFPQVATWTLIDRRRVTAIPPGHWLLIHDSVPFRVRLECSDASEVQAQSISVRDGQFAVFPPGQPPGDAALVLERYGMLAPELTASIRFLPPAPPDAGNRTVDPGSAIVLLTNGIGGMARLCVDLGRIHSKYDCLLGANLDAGVPVDRHIFAKRLRLWVNANRFISALNADNLAAFDPGPPARWLFRANAGDNRVIEIRMSAEMAPERNATVLRLSRGEGSGDLRLTARIDIEDRNFHWETKRSPGADHHFSANVRTLTRCPGFEFVPAGDRRLRAHADAGEYHPDPEWSENIPHPVEADRGQTASGDAYSPGWFDLPLRENEPVTLVVSAEAEGWSPAASGPSLSSGRQSDSADRFASKLIGAARAFVVRRGDGRTVIAGYPWFLDWGRDTLICVRGLLAGGMTEEAGQILRTFGRLEDRGTLPNSIHGGDSSNRETSDAPLWFGLACEEMAQQTGDAFYDTPVGPGGRTIADVLTSIGRHYAGGMPNGVRMDSDSALIWSPSHFTWMDTNHPAGTPREGYPVEIQALWIRMLRQLQRLDARKAGGGWRDLADRARNSLVNRFWLDDSGYLADVLLAGTGTAAAAARPDTALRSNYLFAMSLGLVAGERAQRGVDAALRHLVVPGALRSLAPLPVSPPLPIRGGDGRLLNHPDTPYWGRYEGDEDTRRKPAYHNGTAWVWMMPTFCEALARAWEFSPESVSAARAYLLSLDPLLTQGCLGQLPEILDGDFPHRQRGCDAQAWSATEALRVWQLLNGPSRR